MDWWRAIALTPRVRWWEAVLCGLLWHPWLEPMPNVPSVYQRVCRRCGRREEHAKT